MMSQVNTFTWNPAPKAPQLPPGWIEMQTPDGRPFYYHQQSNTSHWNIPGVPSSKLPIPKSDPFGGARPVDTSKAAEIRQKLLEEKAQKDAIRRAETQSAQEQSAIQELDKETHNQTKINADYRAAAYVVPQRRSPDSAAPRAHGGDIVAGFVTLSDLSADEVSLLMIGLDLPKYAQTLKQLDVQIKGIVLASANDDELTEIFRGIGAPLAHVIELRASIASWKSDPAKVQRVLEVGRSRFAQEEERKRATRTAAVAAAAARIEGKPDIFAAAGSGDLALVRDHLTVHASVVDLKNEAQFTPLHVSAWNGQLEICRLLLQSKADVQAKDRYQQTPLHFCSAINGNLEVARLLVESKSDVASRNSDGNTALKCAMKLGKADVAAYLRSIGAPQ